MNVISYYLIFSILGKNTCHVNFINFREYMTSFKITIHLSILFKNMFLRLSCLYVTTLQMCRHTQNVQLSTSQWQESLILIFNSKNLIVLPSTGYICQKIVINYICCMRAKSLQSRQTRRTLWNIAYQAPLPMGFSRQAYRNGLPCPPPGHLPDSGTKCKSLSLLPWQAGSLPLVSPGKP